MKAAGTYSRLVEMRLVYDGNVNRWKRGIVKSGSRFPYGSVGMRALLYHVVRRYDGKEKEREKKREKKKRETSG